MYMLCRNRVADFDKWKAVFDAQAEAHRDVGMRLVNLWQCVDDPENVFFLLEVADRAKADAFLFSPESAQVGMEADVISGASPIPQRVSPAGP